MRRAVITGVVLCLILLVLWMFFFFPWDVFSEKLVKKPKAEAFSNSFLQSNLQKNMDYMKDTKGRTLDDYILYNHMVTGSGIDSPF